MSEFNDILKQKLEQFEVPYNEAHWAEMEGKLNAARSAKIKTKIFSAAAVISVLSVLTYFILPNSTPTDTAVVPTIEQQKEEAGNDNSLTTNEEEVLANNRVKISESNVIEVSENNENEQKPEQNTSIENVETEHQTTTSEKAPIQNQTSSLNITPEFIVYNNNICLGESVSFESSDNERSVSYLWNFGDGITSNKANPKHRYTESNTYSVSLIVTDNMSGQEFTSKQENVVRILPSPKVDFTYNEESKKYDDNVLKYPFTKFNVKNAVGTNVYKWTFGNGESSSSPKARTIYKNTGLHIVSLSAESSNGCITKIEKSVKIKNKVTLLTDAFSPNQDGNNETFIPKALLEWDVRFEMTIMNVAGTVVYKTADKYEPWNGKMNNTGQLMPEGIYIWQLVVTDAEGNAHNYQDKIQLVK